jgi:hypothetical protein
MEKPVRAAGCDQLRTLQNDFKEAVRAWEQATFPPLTRGSDLRGVPTAKHRRAVAARNTMALRIVNHLQNCGTCKQHRICR